MVSFLPAASDVAGAVGGQLRCSNGTDYANPAAYKEAIGGGTAANTFLALPRAGTVRGLTAWNPGVLSLGFGTTVTLMKNGVATALAVTTAALDTPVSISGTVTFAAGDKLTIRVVDTSGTNYVAWGLSIQ